MQRDLAFIYIFLKFYSDDTYSRLPTNSDSIDNEFSSIKGWTNDSFLTNKISEVNTSIKDIMQCAERISR